MTNQLTLALAQINPHVGNLAGNAGLIRAARAQAAEAGADLVIFSDLALCGYPPEDLLLHSRFLVDCRSLLDQLAAETVDGGPALLLGAPVHQGDHLGNGLALLDQGGLAALRFQSHLPNIRGLDDKRVFIPGPIPEPILFRGFRLGALLGEDLWIPEVCAALVKRRAEILIALNASPFEEGKRAERQALARSRIQETGLPLVYVNQVGGQDDLLFDGGSFAMDMNRRDLLALPVFQSALGVLTLSREAETLSLHSGQALARELGREETLYTAMTLALRDYVTKNGFSRIFLGLSGGIDSALVAAIAVDALGSERVRAVMMPSPYTSQESLEDAAGVAERLGIALDSIPIEPAMMVFSSMFAPFTQDRAADVTEENIQSRVRGMILMALSNKLGGLVLSTGNKSELAVGYATLYGDMCGGYAVLKDLYKTDVFAVAQWRNRAAPAGALGARSGSAALVMPARVLTKAPTAELKPNQTDQDTLPPYDRLDAILVGMIEEGKSLADLVNEGFEAALLARISGMLDRAEFKRRQGAPGVKLTRRCFGREWRHPITNGYREELGG